MPAAYVILGNDGVVVRSHSNSLPIGGVLVGNPTTAASDLENLIQLGYQHVREIPLDGGRVLIVMFRP